MSYQPPLLMMSGKRKSVWKNQAGDEHSRRHCRHSFGDIEEHDGNEAAANGHLVTVSPPTSLSRPSQSPSFHFSLPPKLNVISSISTSPSLSTSPCACNAIHSTNIANSTRRHVNIIDMYVGTKSSYVCNI